MADKISIDGKRELRWLYVGNCLVTYLEADVEFRDSLWDQWLEVVKNPRTSYLMICAWGATQPSNQQWRRATKLMRERDLPVSVVTEARHNSALAKAASWLGTNIKSFRWSELNEACDNAGFDRDGRVAGRAKITALRDYYGAVVRDEVGSESSFGGFDMSPSPFGFSSDFEASGDIVRETNDDIQARLAEVQERLRSRTAFNSPGKIID